MLNGTTLKIIENLEKHPRKTKIAAELINVLSESEVSDNSIYTILQD